MPHLYLPADHSDADLVLATQVAEAVESAELWVAWTPEAGLVAPEVEAYVREPTSPFAETLSAVCLGIVALLRLLTGRHAAQSRPAARRQPSREDAIEA